MQSVFLCHRCGLFFRVLTYTDKYYVIKSKSNYDKVWRIAMERYIHIQ